MDNLEKAKNILSGSDYTCVMCSDSDSLTSVKRGVAPLLEWLDAGKDMSGYSAADKVIGNGAAFLYVLLGIKNVFANVISRAALETLEKNSITVSYDTLADAVMNRDNTGYCPIESAVKGIESPEDALAAIRKRLAEMKRS